MNYSVESNKANTSHSVLWEDGVEAVVTGTWSDAADIGRCRSITRETEANVAAIDRVLRRLRDSVEIVEHVSREATNAIALLEGL